MLILRVTKIYNQKYSTHFTMTTFVRHLQIYILLFKKATFCSLGGPFYYFYLFFALIGSCGDEWNSDRTFKLSTIGIDILQNNIVSVMAALISQLKVNFKKIFSKSRIERYDKTIKILIQFRA